MGIDVQLRSESGQVLDAVSDRDMVLSRAAQRQFSKTRLLRYLVPYGDAVFNQSQSADLADDVAGVRRDDPDSPLSARLGEVEHLIQQLSAHPHVYLWFVGD
jgi:hypothetical protein